MASFADFNTQDIPQEATTSGIIANTIKGIPKAFADVLGKPALQGYAAMAGFLTGNKLTPETPFQKELYGTDKPISFSTVGANFGVKETSKVAPVLGVLGSIGDLIPGGKAEIQGALRATKTAEEALQILRGAKIPEEIASHFAPLFASAKTAEEVKPLFSQLKGVLGFKSLVDIEKAGKQLDPLAQEAQKYKSAEEFVKAQTPIFRGQESAPAINRVREGATPEYTGTAFSRQREQAQKYGDLTLSKYIPEGKILMPKDISPEILKNLRKEFDNLDVTDANSVPTERLITKVMELAKQNNKDAADIAAFFKGMAEDGEIRVLDKTKALTKSQLTDLWNKSTKAAGEASQTLKSLQTEPQLPQISSLPKSVSSLGESVSPDTGPVQRLIKALQEANPIRGKQEALYTAERSARLAKVAGVQSNTSGESGYFAELSKLKGELPKVSYESIRNNFSQEDIDSLFNMVKDSPKLDLFEQITGRGALLKMFGTEGGAVPTKGELKILSQVFPKEMIDTLLAHRPFSTKLWEGITNALNVPRALLSSFDLSAPFRQGVFLVGRKEFFPAFAGMFKQFGNEKAFQAVQDEIFSRPTYALMKKSRLALTELGTFLDDREEKFMSNFAEQIPLAGRVVRASGRAYVGFLNKLRADTFDSLVKLGKQTGNEMGDDTLKSLATFINSATGRGDLGTLNRAAPALNAVFFSPRLMASRMNLLNPVYYAKLDPFVRKQALKSLLSFAGIAGTVLGLAKMGGANVGADPRNADFGKIRLGPTRLDILGGFQQYIRLASQLLSGKIVSSTTGKVMTLGEGYKPLTRLDILQRFFQGKENPIASFITDFLQGEDMIGNKFKLSTEVVQRFIPLVAQDLTDAIKEWGPSGALTAIPATFGIGTQTYGAPKSKKASFSNWK